MKHYDGVITLPDEKDQSTRIYLVSSFSTDMHKVARVSKKGIWIYTDGWMYLLSPVVHPTGLEYSVHSQLLDTICTTLTVYGIQWDLAPLPQHPALPDNK